MQIQSTVGPQRQSGGAKPNLRAGLDGELVVADAHGRYEEGVSRGKVFTASNQAGKALTAFATSATTGFVLHNPQNSGKRLSILEIIFQQTSTATTAVSVVSLAANISPTATQPSGLTSLTVYSAQLGSTVGATGRVYSDATLGTADVIVRALWTPSVSATATTGIPAVIKDEVAGALEILPGCWVAMSATSALSGITTMTWEEIDI